MAEPVVVDDDDDDAARPPTLPLLLPATIIHRLPLLRAVVECREGRSSSGVGGDSGGRRKAAPSEARPRSRAVDRFMEAEAVMVAILCVCAWYYGHCGVRTRGYSTSACVLSDERTGLDTIAR